MTETPPPAPAADERADDLARECLYRFLAAALTDPRREPFGLALDPPSQLAAAAAADLLREEALAAPVPLGFGELPPEALDLADVCAALARPPDELRADYDRVFGLVYARECPPYETEYCPTAEPFYRAQQLADVAGFYRAFGLTGARALPERPDHVANELEFMAVLFLKDRLAADRAGPEATDRTAVCAAARAAFFSEHLAWWVPSFTAGLRRKAGDGLYAALGRALAALLPAERGRFGVKAPRAPVRPALIERPEEDAGCAGCAAGRA
jgi:TorA maturation chaperone TorD